jgi:hypothetical protein
MPWSTLEKALLPYELRLQAQERLRKSLGVRVMNRKKWMSCGGRCLSVCPWNKEISPLHNIVRGVAIHSPNAIKKVLASMDRRFYRRKKTIVGEEENWQRKAREE